jgi:hypothetical protein
MSGKRDDKQAKPPTPSVVRSDGEEAAQGYVEAELPEQPRSPTMEMERVHFTDPRRAPTMRREDMLKDIGRKAAGPRAPGQKALKPANDPGVEAPDARPATKMQALHFDEDLLAEMRQKLAAPRGEGSAESAPTGAPAEAANDAEPMPAGAGVDSDEEKSGPKPASPWSKDAAAGEPVRQSALPSSLRPRDTPAPEGGGEKPERAPAGERGWTARALVVALVVVAVALALRAAFTSPRTTEPGNATQHPSPKPTLTAAGPTERPAPNAAQAPSAEPQAAPPPIATGTASAAPVTSSAAERHPAPKPSSAIEDPYDAAVTPLPAMTAEPAAPTTAPTAQPVAPKATATSHPAAPLTSGRILGGEE